jgi:DNA mismatch endonuclease (patch repair protein)
MRFDDVPDVVRHRMSKIRKTGSKPELLVRKIAHRLGYRFRINRSDLPGTPDVVFPARRKVIFVHGCFWHQHVGCHHANTPRTRPEYWLPKLARTIERDQSSIRALHALGWDAMVIWECEIRDSESLKDRLEQFLA